MPKRVEPPKRPTVGDELAKMKKGAQYAQIRTSQGPMAADASLIDRIMKPKRGGLPQKGK